MYDKIEEKTVILPPFKHFIMTVGEIPTSYLETMTYYEMLVWFTNYLGKTVIPAINENGEAVTELQNLFVELQNYVNDYFENLDVQEEINNKLDDMVEAGTLQEIIADYLNSKAVFGYDTVADMKVATNLIDGSYAKTLGYYEKNDKGSALYKIREITNDDVVDETTIIALSNDSLIAELILNNTMNIECFGAKGDGTTNDTEALEIALDKINTIVFSDKTYLMSTELYFNKNEERTLIGNNTKIKGLMLNLNTENKTDWLIAYKNKYFTAQNIEFVNNNNDNAILCFQPFKFIDCYVSGYDSFFKLRGLYVDKFYIDGLEARNHTGTNYLFDLNALGDEHYINNYHIANSENLKSFFGINKRGLIIQNSLNGTYEFKNSNIKFLNDHFESGNIIIENNIGSGFISNVEFDNCFFYQSFVMPINDLCVYNNCIIYTMPSLNNTTSTNLNYQAIKGTNNIIKSHETSGNISAIGLVRLDGIPTLTYSANKVALSTSQATGTGLFNADKVSYTYTVFCSIDKNSINGSNYTYSTATFTSTIGSNVDCLSINGIDNLYRNCYLHVYRTNNSDNTIKKCVIFNNSSRIFDYGTTLSGIAWESADSVPTGLNASGCSIVNGIIKTTNAANLNGTGYLYIDNTDNVVKYK